MTRLIIAIVLIAFTVSGCASTRTEAQKLRIKQQLERDSQTKSLCDSCS